MRYIAHDYNTIHGIGDTPDKALSDALSQCPELVNLWIHPATSALIAEVESRGGAIAWDEVYGIACTSGSASPSPPLRPPAASTSHGSTPPPSWRIGLASSRRTQ